MFVKRTSAIELVEHHRIARTNVHVAHKRCIHRNSATFSNPRLFVAPIGLATAIGHEREAAPIFSVPLEHNRDELQLLQALIRELAKLRIGERRGRRVRRDQRRREVLQQRVGAIAHEHHIIRVGIIAQHHANARCCGGAFTR